MMDAAPLLTVPTTAAAIARAARAAAVVVASMSAAVAATSGAWVADVWWTAVGTEEARARGGERRAEGFTPCGKLPVNAPEWNAWLRVLIELAMCDDAWSLPILAARTYMAKISVKGAREPAEIKAFSSVRRMISSMDALGAERVSVSGISRLSGG